MVKFHFTCEVEAENIVEAFKKLGLSQNQTNAGEVAVTCTHISVPEQPTQIQSAPVVPTVAPVASIPQPIAPIIPPAPVVPTTAPTYTFDQIAAAGAVVALRDGRLVPGDLGRGHGRLIPGPTGEHDQMSGGLVGDLDPVVGLDQS